MWALVSVVLVALMVAADLGVVLSARASTISVMTALGESQAGLERGLQQLEDGYKNEDPAKVRAAAASFTDSRNRLWALDRRLRPLDVLGQPGVPGIVSDRVDTLDAVIRVAVHLDEAGRLGARTLLESGLVGGASGAALPIGRIIELLGSIRAELAEANRLAAGIDLGVLPGAYQGTLRRALDELRFAVGGLDALWPSIDAVLDLLGLDGPRTYLVEQTNPAELRAGGGFIGTVSLIHADRGKVTLARSLPVEAFDYCDAAGCVHPRPQPWQPGYVAPPAELAGPPLPPYSQLSAWSLEDSGFAPDFATNATVAETFARRLLGTRIDGVIAVDYYAVAPLLELTGPIELPEYHLTLTAANFVDTVVGLDLARDYAHKDVISAAAARIVARLSVLSPADAPKLIRIVQEMIKGRHLQVHFDAEGVQRETSRLGATEVLNPKGAADFLLETEDNYGGSKSNYFLQRRYRLDLGRSGSLLRHTLTIDLHDGAPPDKQFIGPHYFAYVRITVPADATNVSVASAQSPEYAPIEAPSRRTQVPPHGAQVAGGWIFVLVGDGLSGSYQVTFTWDTPWRAAAGEPVTMYWQKQPGTVRDPVQVTWTSDDRQWSTSGDLGEDRLVVLGQHGVALRPAVGGAPPP